MSADVERTTCHLVASLTKTPESVHRLLAVTHRKNALIRALRFEQGRIHDKVDVTLECDVRRSASLIAALEREVVVVELRLHQTK